MYNLFNEDVEPLSGMLNLSVLNVIKGNLSGELNKLLAYYHEYGHAVNSGHFFTHILNNLPMSFNDDMDYYHFKILNMTDDLSRVLKLTSPIFQGKVFDGVVYGKGTREVYICVTEDYSDYQDKKWYDLQPIKVISHPRTSLLFNPNKNEDFESEYGIAVFTIDIPMMMVQYRSFLQNELENDTDGSTRSMMQYIGMFLIPNILYSHMDVAIFNRLASWQNGVVPSTELPRFPVAIINYTRQLDKALISVTNMLNKARKDFNFILKNIPAISKENYFEVIRIPPMAITRQVKWALLLTRLPTIRYLVKQMNITKFQGNREEKNEIRRQAREMKNDKTIAQTMDMATYEKIQFIMDNEILPNLD